MLDRIRLSSEDEWLINHAPAGQHKIACPWCGPARKKHHETPLSSYRDPDHIVYNCHHCGITGSIYTKEKPLMLQIAPKVEPKNLDNFESLGETQKSWLTSRGISLPTAQKYHLVGGEAYNTPRVGFPYVNPEGQIEAVKFRSTVSKTFSCDGSPRSFFGLNNAIKGEPLIIVEGEMDVLAIAESCLNAVSVPNGAPMKVMDGRIDPSEDKKFKFLWDAKEYIHAAPMVIIATDSDTQGEALAEEIARRVGKEKCWRVKWPDKIKDANEFLMKNGAEALAKAILGATAWPVEGLYDAKHFEAQVHELYDKGLGRGESTGYPSLDELYTIVPGQVTIVTGIPSSGKSEFIDQVMTNLALDKHWRFGVCSFENEPRIHIAKLMSKRVGKPFFDGHNERLSEDEYKAAFSGVDDHFVFVHQENGGLSDLDSILDRLRVAIMRHGIRGAVIDPYNFIARPRGEASETEWISEMLTKVKAFAMGHGIHIWFIAHPTKMQRGQDGKIPVPGGFDISGSASWFAKADCGLTVHREKDDPLISQIHIWKCRFAWVGKQGQTNLLYNIGTTRYSEYNGVVQQEPDGFL